MLTSLIDYAFNKGYFQSESRTKRSGVDFNFWNSFLTSYENGRGTMIRGLNDSFFHGSYARRCTQTL
ncbi:hypothetical protein KPH14_006816 [Odynerus spinipes]|uniref:Uncharacterized protein n=1 Tax=Odynerus spinipes TaxID=1348599 RepID=A0AAD9RSG7_9HYME|nr:hypothetical protein KPH14_006816 [Odynerus spinipes]